MQCYSCNIAGICKIYQMVNDSKLIATVTISDCKVANGGPSVRPVDIEKARETLYKTREQRTPEQLSAISEKIKNNEPGVMAIRSMPSRKTCPSCDNKTSGEILNCSKCGTQVCDSCLTESIEDKKTYCEKCWDSDELS